MTVKIPKVGLFYDREHPGRKTRQWQDEWFDVFVQKVETEKSMLLVACPAAGKTVAALRAIHARLESGDIDMVIVVAHSRSLCEQWIKKAACYGIELKTFKNGDGGRPSGFHGIAITYQQAARQPDIFGTMCRENIAAVILDEGHHAGEKKSWGIALRTAFEYDAALVLTLSGTPFRHDGTKMPFIEYDDDGICIPTHTYSYTQAISDGVCRKVEFPMWNATVKWYVSRENDDELEPHEHDFDKPLPETERATRLRQALWDKRYVSAMIGSANELLRDLRQDDPQAGGIVFAMSSPDNDEDDRHANFIAKIVEEVTGFRPRVITYDNEDALTDRRAFEQNDEPWVVCIKMISEGVDIPRLRVGVHATNTTALLFFKQAVGRVLRQQIAPTKDKDGSIVEDDKYLDDYAYYLIPKDPLLVENAEKMEAEVMEAIAKIEKKGPGGDPPKPRTSTTTVISAGTENQRPDGSTYATRQYKQSPLDKAAEVIKSTGMKCSPAQLLKAYEMMSKNNPEAEPIPQESAPTHKPVVPKDVRVADARKKLSDAVRSLAIARSKVSGAATDYKGATDELNVYMGSLVDKKYLNFRQADEPELNKGLSWVKQQKANLPKSNQY
jgi:superfamily II DNA or RNA helicase